MKAEIKIPKGYRRLRRGETINPSTDLWFDRYSMEWSETTLAVKVRGLEPIIRPTPNKRTMKK